MVQRIRRLVLPALVLLLAAAVVGAPAPASATVAEGFIAGTGVVSDDWDDEGVVDYNTHAYSGATGLWQLVLYADGAIEQDGTRFDLADVDCEFGPNTRAATRNWQSTHQVGVDGSAGPQTFSRAGRSLGSSDGGSTVNYWGNYYSLTFYRAANGAYIVTQFDWDYAYYDRKPADCF